MKYVNGDHSVPKFMVYPFMDKNDHDFQIYLIDGVSFVY